jgi:hypothetical protein
MSRKIERERKDTGKYFLQQNANDFYQHKLIVVILPNMYRLIKAFPIYSSYKLLVLPVVQILFVCSGVRTIGHVH